MSLETVHQTRRFTVDEVMTMVASGILAEDEPLELLRGELVVVSPQGPPHATATSRMARTLYRAYAPPTLVREAKPLAVSDDSLPEPDFSIVEGDEDTFFERHPRGDEAVLVIEVSYTSQQADHDKAAIYASAMVPVYWLLDLKARRLEVHSEPEADGRYGVVRLLHESDEVELPRTRVRLRVGDLLR
ncbi:MAG: Uma2 family endonuclease [Myxococcales bacterium]|nr:Uma2 family endonuclease [Myxococcales bacterium]